MLCFWEYWGSFCCALCSFLSAQILVSALILQCLVEVGLLVFVAVVLPLPGE